MNDANKITQIIIENDVESLSNLVLDDWCGNNYEITGEINMQIDNTNLTLIHIAAYYDSFECFKLLEKKGLSLSTQSAAQLYPIHYIIYGGSIELLQYVLDKAQKDIDTSNLIKNIFDNDIQIIQSQKTLLDLAILAPAYNFEITSLLMENKYGIRSDGRDYRSLIVEKPINACIFYSNAKCLELLLPFKSMIHRGLSPLQIAIVVNDDKATALLAKSSENLMFRNSKGETALSIACKCNNIYAVKTLCEKMSSLEEKGYGLDGAAHWACSSNNYEIAKIILKRNVDVNRKNQLGQLCVGYFKVSKNNINDVIKILDLLIDNGFDLNDPSYPAIQPFITGLNIYPEIVDWFLSKGIDIDIPIVRHVGTFLIRDIICSKKNTLQSLIDKYKIKPSLPGYY